MPTYITNDEMKSGTAYINGNAIFQIKDITTDIQFTSTENAQDDYKKITNDIHFKGKVKVDKKETKFIRKLIRKTRIKLRRINKCRKRRKYDKNRRAILQ